MDTSDHSSADEIYRTYAEKFPPASKMDTSEYGGGGLNEWRPMKPRGAPFEMYEAQFKSSSLEAELFIHHPLRTLRGEFEGINSEAPAAGVPDDARVATLVFNHERSLAKSIIWAFATVNPGHVWITIYKEGDDQPAL